MLGGPDQNELEPSGGSRRHSGNEAGIYSGVDSYEPKKVTPASLLGLSLPKFKLMTDIFVGSLPLQTSQPASGAHSRSKGRPFSYTSVPSALKGRGAVELT